MSSKSTIPLEEDISFDCSVCWEPNFLTISREEFAHGEGISEVYIDCSVCCNPLHLRISCLGEVLNIQVEEV